MTDENNNNSESEESGVTYKYETTYTIKDDDTGEVLYQGDGTDILGGGSSDSSDESDSSGSNDDLTFEDILTNIASAIDAHWYIIDKKVYFISYDMLFAGGKSVNGFEEEPLTVELWMQEDDTYEMDVNQYGFYNSVYVNYKDGTVNACNNDLIRIFSEVPIEYDEPELSYSQAVLKAQMYLSAHIRDFGMEINVDVLHTGKIKAGMYIKIVNPLTLDENLYFVRGFSANWSASENTFVSSLILTYGPENPDNPEVPETGAAYTGTEEGDDGSVYAGNVSADVCTAAKQIIQGKKGTDAKAKAIFDWVDQSKTYRFYNCREFTSSEALQASSMNCADSAALLADLLTCANVPNKILTGTCTFRGGNAYGHYWNAIQYQGSFVCADAGRGSTGNFGTCNHSCELNGRELGSSADVC